jgi:putative Mg2+ transporter-C (MgtC) family protein
MDILSYFFAGDQWISVQRLLVAVLLGAIVGLERERSGKTAGLRTHALVSRIVSNVLVGIGFVGGGAILKTGDHVLGITTAATLWVTGAIGVASGFGFYTEAMATTIIAYLTLTVFWYLEQKYGHDLWYQSVKDNPVNAKDIGPVEK